MLTTHYEPGNPIVFLSDPNMGIPPTPKDGEPFLATSTCISMTCTSFIDGGTSFSLGPYFACKQDRRPDFDGILTIPAKKVVLSTAEGDLILESDWNETTVRVRIWANAPMWPDALTIGLG